MDADAGTRVSEAEVASPLVRTEVLHASYIYLKGELLDGARRRLLTDDDSGAGGDATPADMTRPVLDAALAASAAAQQAVWKAELRGALAEQAAAFDARLDERLRGLEEAYASEISALRVRLDQLLGQPPPASPAAPASSQP
jgi:hypothetical protein